MKLNQFRQKKGFQLRHMFFTFDILLAQKTDNSHTQDKKKTNCT